MGQIISSIFRFLSVEEVKRNWVDNSPLISHHKGLNCCENINMDGDDAAIFQGKPTIDVPVSTSEPCMDSDTHHNDQCSSVADNSINLCLSKGSGTVCVEIKDIIVNEQDAHAANIERVDDGIPEKMDFVDVGKLISKEVSTAERRLGPYTSSQKMLLVGEGDFSFSAALAQAFGSAVNMLATSLDSKEFLSNNYRRHAMNNITNLTERGATVLHNVDCTKMVDLLSSMRFDRIIYNFPHAGFCDRDEPRQSQLCRHRSLISLFLGNAKQLLKEDGEIHITHKSNAFFRQWDIKSLASGEGLFFLQELPFCRQHYPGYRTMCGFGGNNFFYCHPCKTYKFGHIKQNNY